MGDRAKGLAVECRTGPSAALVIVALLCSVGSVGCTATQARSWDQPTNATGRLTTVSSSKVLQGAKRQLLKPAAYHGAYVRIGYPNGDVPANRVVCTDVVIRALRYAGKDLQRLIHEDMKRRFGTYPRRERRPDPNIDHRRVPNQIHFLRRFGKTLTTDVNGRAVETWQPGDIVYWKLDNGLDHTGIVSDRLNDRGEPFVIHNIWQTAEEDVLTKWRIVGHYRYP